MIYQLTLHTAGVIAGAFLVVVGVFGLMKPDSGRIIVDGEDITDMDEGDLSVDQTVLRGDLAGVDHLLPSRRFLGLVASKMLGRVADDLESEFGQVLLDLRIVQRGDDGAMQLRANIGRQTLRRDDSLPRVHIDTLHAALGKCRHLWQQW